MFWLWLRMAQNQLRVEHIMKTRILVYGGVLLLTTSGATVNAVLISGLDAPFVAISPVPEPSPIVLAGVGAALLWLWLFWRGVD